MLRARRQRVRRSRPVRAAVSADRGRILPKRILVQPVAARIL